MKTFKLSITIIAISIFLMACTANQPQQSTPVASAPINSDALADGEFEDVNGYWAKDNLDMQRVGNLLERSNNPEEFERYLNSDDGINNLDLNGDGYVDYISVDEYQDRGDYERGLSLYTRFGPNDVQELGTVVFYRDDNRSPGARVLVTGNQQLYGDNNYYETNWLDRTLGLVSLLFGSRDTPYRSPYYYNKYPSYYNVYEVVETPYYRTRIERLYPQPIFIYTTSPTFVTRIKIKSPNNGLHLGQIKARLVKPTKDQEEFIKNNPGRPKAIKADKNDKGGKHEDGPKPYGQPKADRDVKGENSKPSKPPQVEKPNPKSQKPEQKGPNKGKGKP